MKNKEINKLQDFLKKIGSYKPKEPPKKPEKSPSKKQLEETYTYSAYYRR